ncbi:serine hydrolase domain-containing protein [Marinifilum sp. D737]|uniref:serine hydrolase domain-containing protein n=1 Tax=Marinifilum sp. D737 TaxID=2969628 RepID=UPI00227619B8|nr:serine hydrolase domain-containing protein [Marinifilum sp. D737]MCY1635221.1 beta-lactamase family protein [Marinifilum sp. D737]
MKNLIAILIVLVFASCNVENDPSYKKPMDMNDGLHVSTLESHQLDTMVFNSINKDICEGKYGNMHSLLVMVDNDLVIEQYYNGWKRDKLHFLASNTKSVTSLLLCKAIEQGKIKDVNEKIFDFFPEYGAREKDSLKHQISIKNLLTMTAGFKWDIESQLNQLERSNNRLDFALTLPMDTTPGTKYQYCSPNNIIQSEILKKKTGQNIADYAKINLLAPLGIEEYEWASRNGIYDSYGGLKLRPRDIAKYALLHLNKGKWKDKTIISEEWIQETFSPYIEIKHPLYSCYQWQMAKTDLGFPVWFIPGNGGQRIDIIPALNMLIVINADNRWTPLEGRTPIPHLSQRLVTMHPKLKKQNEARLTQNNKRLYQD